MKILPRLAGFLFFAVVCGSASAAVLSSDSNSKDTASAPATSGNTFTLPASAPAPAAAPAAVPAAAASPVTVDPAAIAADPLAGVSAEPGKMTMSGFSLGKSTSMTTAPLGGNSAVTPTTSTSSGITYAAKGFRIGQVSSGSNSNNSNTTY